MQFVPSNIYQLSYIAFMSIRHFDQIDKPSHPFSPSGRGELLWMKVVIDAWFTTPTRLITHRQRICFQTLSLNSGPKRPSQGLVYIVCWTYKLRIIPYRFVIPRTLKIWLRYQINLRQVPTNLSKWKLLNVFNYICIFHCIETLLTPVKNSRDICNLDFASKGVVC